MADSATNGSIDTWQLRIPYTRPIARQSTSPFTLVPPPSQTSGLKRTNSTSDKCRSVMRRDLPPEIWTIVFTLCQNPLPLPLSNPPRAALEQPHLAKIVQVCKLWREVAEPILYTKIVTDDFAKLLVDVHLPSARRRLALTQSLSLEYLPAGLEVSCESLCRYGGRAWALCGRSKNEDWKMKDPLLEAECWLEAQGLTTALTRANKVGMKEIFPRLEKMSVQPTYAESQTYDRFDGGKYDMDPSGATPLPVGSVTTLFNTFISSGNLKHLCVRSGCGPLTLPAVSYESDRTTNFTKTVHFGAQATENLYLPLGSKVRWVCEGKSTEDWAQLVYDMNRCFSKLIDQRMEDEDRRGFRRDAADVEVYCSTSHLDPGAFYYKMDVFGMGEASGITARDWKYATTFSYDDRKATGWTLSAQQQARIVAHLNNEVQLHFRAGSRVKDSIQWRSSGAAPVCPACSTGIPTAEQIENVRSRAHERAGM